MDFAKVVRANRRRMGLTQEQLAQRVGLTGSSVSQWEAGRAKPHIDVMKKLADVFGMTTSELIGEPSASIVPAHAVGRSRLVPVRSMGVTHAGSPIEEIVDDGVVEVPEGVVTRHPAGFMLRVEGDCMDRAFPPGCMVMVDPDMEARSGDAVVAEPVPGESVLRRYTRGAQTLMLSPDSTNPAHEDLVFSGDDLREVRLIGVVVWWQAYEDVRR